jgi:hypothetical protein
VIGYHTNGAQLGLMTKGTDFYCSKVGGGNYACQGRTAQTTAAFKQLQNVVKTIAAKMAAAGKLAVPPDLVVLSVDGDIGKISSIGVQFVGAAFKPYKAPPPDVAHALASGLTAQEAVTRIAAAAREIAAYFTDVLTNFPAAISAPTPPKPKAFPWGMVLAGAGVLAIFGVAAWLSTRQPGPGEEGGLFPEQL